MNLSRGCFFGYYFFFTKNFNCTLKIFSFFLLFFHFYKAVKSLTLDRDRENSLSFDGCIFFLQKLRQPKKWSRLFRNPTYKQGKIHAKCNIKCFVQFFLKGNSMMEVIYFSIFPIFNPTEIQLFLIKILVFYKKCILTDP